MPIQIVCRSAKFLFKAKHYGIQNHSLTLGDSPLPREKGEPRRTETNQITQNLATFGNKLRPERLSQRLLAVDRMRANIKSGNHIPIHDEYDPQIIVDNYGADRLLYSG
jgi:hypothetical protein